MTKAKNNRSRIIAVLLSLCLLLSLTLTAVAATKTSSQDGLEVTLSTDKDGYSADDTIVATLTVKNTNDVAVESVELETLIPDGYQLAEKSTASTKLNKLEPGAEVSLVTDLVKETTNPDPDNPTPVNPDPDNPTPVSPDPDNPTPVNPDPDNPVPSNSEDDSNSGDDKGTKDSHSDNNSSNETGSNNPESSQSGENASSAQSGENGSNNTGSSSSRSSSASGSASGSSSYSSSGSNSTSNSSSSNNSGKEISVNTGDESNLILWVGIALSALFAILVVYYLKKHKVKLGKVFLSIVLALSLLAPTFAVFSIKANAEKERVEQSVTVNVMLDNSSFGLNAVVTYYLQDEIFETVPLEIGEDTYFSGTILSVSGNPTFESLEAEHENILKINNNELYIAVDDNGTPNYIEGKYSDKTVNNASEAISTLNDIYYLMGFNNVEEEFSLVDETEVPLVETTRHYRFQQMLNGIPVYGYQLVVSVNSEGEVEALSGHYYPSINFEDEAVISEAEAKEIASSNSEDTQVRSNGLVYYQDPETNELQLAWEIDTQSSKYFISAQNGEIISGFSSIIDDSGTGTDLANQNISFPVTYLLGKYWLSDSDKKINGAYYQSSGNLGKIIMVAENTASNWNNHKEAITVYSHMQTIYDYYSNVLGRNAANDKGKKINLIIKYPFSGNNAAFLPSYTSTTVLAFSAGGYCEPLDVVGHEFTHAVTAATWNGTYLNESGALNEAYSDIIGDLIEDRELNLHREDSSLGANRSFAQPELYNQPSHYSNHSAFCNRSGDHSKHSCDNGGVHKNSGIINHAAYLMDQTWPSSNHSEELATLFYKSMQYLTPNSSFVDCRHAVQAAARSLQLSEEKKKAIAKAFDDVGVVNKNEENWLALHHITGFVQDAENYDVVPDAQVMLTNSAGTNVFASGYTNADGYYDLKVRRGTYRMLVSARGYSPYVVQSVDMTSWTQLYYSMENIYLVPSAWQQKESIVAGYVKDSVSNSPIANAIIRFRQSSNNQRGTYVKGDNGIIIELSTDENGHYYTSALDSGNYTAEIIKDGYVTAFRNVISGDTESCNEQNVLMTPLGEAGTYRIVLTWDEQPRDMDSHVEGVLSSGEPFHVYYGWKSQYDGDTEVCDLDVDDVDSYGPETVTLVPNNAAPYYYYVYKFAGDKTTATSGSKVRVYNGSRLVREYNVPVNQGDGDFWNVFAIVNGNIVEKNTIASEADLTYASN